MKTFIRCLIAFFLMILCLLLFSLTSVGGEAIFQVAVKLVPGQIHYKTFKGSLFGPIRIQNFEYLHDNVCFSFDSLQLQWYPAALFSGELSIKKLVVDQLKIVTAAKVSTTPKIKDSSSSRSQIKLNLPSPNSLDLPFKLKIKKGIINGFYWGTHSNKWLVTFNQGEINGILRPDKLDFQIVTDLKKPYPISTQLYIRGNLDNYLLDLKAADRFNSWYVIGEGSRNSLHLQTIKSNFLKGHLSGKIVLNWQKGWDWQVDLNGQTLNFKAINSSLPTQVNFILKSQGQLIRNQPYFSWLLNIHTPKNQIISKGSRTQFWQGTWIANIQDAKELLANSRGKINSRGEWYGNWPLINFKGILVGQGINWKDIHADNLNSQWQVDLNRGQQSKIQAQGNNIKLFNYEFKTFNIQMIGNWLQHQIGIALSNPTADFHSQVQGKWDGKNWTGNINQLVMQSKNAGTWSLQKPITFFANKQKVTLPQFCLYSSLKGQFCGYFEKNLALWKTNLSGNFNLELLSVFLPKTWKMQSPVAIQLIANGKGKALQQANGFLSLGKGELIFPANDHILTLPLEKGKVNLTVQKQNAEVLVALFMNASNYLQAQFNLPNYALSQIINRTQKIDGKIKVHYFDIKAISTLIPKLTTLRANIEGDFTVHGTLKQPELTGQAKLTGGQFRIPEYGIELENGTLTAVSDKQLIKFIATAYSGGRLVKTEGRIDLTKPDFPIEIHVTGNDPLIVNTPDYKFYGNPDININIKGFNLTLNGKVNILQAIIQPVDIKGAVLLPEDEVIILGGKTKKPSKWKVTMTLDIYLSNQVLINAQGLTGNLLGHLTLLKSPHQPILGVGRITINGGKFTILGRELNLAPHSGVIFRRNLLNNPNLDVQAYTVVNVNDTTGQDIAMDDVKVAVNITGTATNPQFTFFSSPGGLTQNDIISYLVLGSSSTGASPAVAGQLLQAVTSMRGKSKDNLTSIGNRVKQGLGFTELGVETEASLTSPGVQSTQQSTFVVLGRRITPNLSARYKFDPLSGTNILAFYYLLTKHFRIQTEKSTLGTGADALYTFEEKYKPSSLELECRKKEQAEEQKEKKKIRRDSL